MFWVRIDNRLVHGQIIEAWLPYTGADVLVVVNDELAQDDLRQEIMAMAIPQDVTLRFASIDRASDVVADLSVGGHAENVLVLLATCPDAKRAFEEGLRFDELNVGNLHYGPGKKQVCPHVSLSGEDESCLEFFSQREVQLDYRCVPNDPVQIKGRR
ncbi:PTS sugar transporter subunit IIB [Desulfohalovibrio reitneri]|uniref:PTS sugar transporter subunit IIB n=1 Tax=Desulfohalovibrio reitneri TaxID=1307759 RepID=UPI0004A73634|nr:PTS sugar transporter subunit IIB [Desulfohalovibrio reitneri]